RCPCCRKAIHRRGLLQEGHTPWRGRRSVTARLFCDFGSLPYAGRWSEPCPRSAQEDYMRIRTTIARLSTFVAVALLATACSESVGPANNASSTGPRLAGPTFD